MIYRFVLSCPISTDDPVFEAVLLKTMSLEVKGQIGRLLGIAAF
jgi:hypothetical protein